MQITIIAIGKESDPAYRSIMREYEKRLSPHAAIRWNLLPAVQSKNTEDIKKHESAAILTRCRPNDTIILLDERGTQFTNTVFSTKFTQLAGEHGHVVFVIGGAFGVDATVRERARLVWSFSDLVFPHQMMRVLLLEQLYRTFMILRGHPYHHV